MNSGKENKTPEAQREDKRKPLAERVDSIARDLVSKAGSGGREMPRDEIDAMWGHG